MTSNTIRTSTSTTRIIRMVYAVEDNIFFLGGCQSEKRRICHRIEGGEFHTYNEGKEGVGRFSDAR